MLLLWWHYPKLISVKPLTGCGMRKTCFSYHYHRQQLWQQQLLGELGLSLDRSTFCWRTDGKPQLPWVSKPAVVVSLLVSHTHTHSSDVRWATRVPYLFAESLSLKYGEGFVWLWVFFNKFFQWRTNFLNLKLYLKFKYIWIAEITSLQFMFFSFSPTRSITDSVRINNQCFVDRISKLF